MLRGAARTAVRSRLLQSRHPFHNLEEAARQLCQIEQVQLCSFSSASPASLPDLPPQPSVERGSVGEPKAENGRFADKDAEGQTPGLSAEAIQRRNLRKTIPRPLSELDRACIQMLWRRNPSEPIEVTLHRAQFPLTAPNLSLVLAHIRSARDALRLFLCFLRANPSFVPDKALIDVLIRFWKHERERFPVFLSILNELRTASCVMTPRRLTTFLRGYGWAGLVDEVLNYLNECEASYGFQPDFVHYSCALHTCIEENRMDVAMQIFDQMYKNEKPPTYDTFQALISGLLNANQPTDAASLFERMLESKLIKPNQLPRRVVSYVSIVEELLRSRDTMKAGEFLMKLNDMGFTPDYFTCCDVLGAYAARGLDQEQRDLYIELNCKRLLPDFDGLKRFVSKHGRGSITSETQKLLHALLASIEGLVTSTAVKEAGCLENDPPQDDDAVEPLPSSAMDVQSNSCPDDDDEEQVNPADILLFDRIIYGLCVRDKPEDAIELLLRMVEDPIRTIIPTACTSVMLFDALCWESKWEEAENLLKMMMKWGHTPDNKIFNVWIQGSCKADRVDHVNALFDEFKDKGLDLDAISHNMIVEKLCMSGKLNEAKNVSKEAKGKLGTPDVVTYSRMIQSFAKAGDFDTPRKLLTEMAELGITPFALPFTPLVQRLCLSGKPDEALALVEEIERKGCKPLPSLYTLIVSAYCKGSKLEDAFNVMDIMKAKGVTPEPQTHRDLFGSCMGTRMLKPAVQAS